MFAVVHRGGGETEGGGHACQHPLFSDTALVVPWISLCIQFCAQIYRAGILMIYGNMAWKKLICFTNLKILENYFRGQKGPVWTCVRRGSAEPLAISSSLEWCIWSDLQNDGYMGKHSWTTFQFETTTGCNSSCDNAGRNLQAMRSGANLAELATNWNIMLMHLL